MFDIWALFDDIIESHNSKINGPDPYPIFESEEENKLMWKGMVATYQDALEWAKDNPGRAITKSPSGVGFIKK